MTPVDGDHSVTPVEYLEPIETGLLNVTWMRRNAKGKPNTMIGLPWSYVRFSYEDLRPYVIDWRFPEETPHGARILVCGSRFSTDARLIWAVLDKLDKRMGLEEHPPEITTVIEGHAEGVDRWAREWAESHQKENLTFRADWDKYGGAAGPKRNQKMATEGQPDVVIAFPGGAGTADMRKKAKIYSLKLIEFV